MALTLSCSCGATFDVEDTFAGQTVSCPECHASLKAPVLRRGPLRTSGLAVASTVLALVGAFTLVGTLAAVLCGLAALVWARQERKPRQETVTILALDTKAKTITVPGPKKGLDRAITLGSEVKITVNGKQATLEDVKLDSRAVLTYAEDGKTVIKLEVREPKNRPSR